MIASSSFLALCICSFADVLPPCLSMGVRPSEYTRKGCLLAFLNPRIVMQAVRDAVKLMASLVLLTKSLEGLVTSHGMT